MKTVPFDVMLFLAFFVSSCSMGQDAVEYQTDWIAPYADVGRNLKNVVAIELKIAPIRLNQYGGHVVFYTGDPDYDEFGDSDKSLLQRHEKQVVFEEYDGGIVPFGLIEERYVTRKTSSLYVVRNDDELTGLRLVLDEEFPNECSLLLVDTDGLIRRIFPLQWEQRTSLARQSPKSDPLLMHLRSDPIPDVAAKAGSIVIYARGEAKSMTRSHGVHTLDRFGHAVCTDAVGYIPLVFELEDLNCVDRTGQDRHVFRFVPPKHADKISGLFLLFNSNDDTKTQEEYYLVIHPSECGPHRLLIMKDGNAEQIVPLRSAQYEMWLRVRSTIEDEKEQAVYDRISLEIPYFDGFTTDQGRTVSVRIPLPNGKEELISSLVDLPDLRSLEIAGDLPLGNGLAKLQSLECFCLSEGRISKEALNEVAKLTCLKELSFRNVQMNFRDWNAFRELRFLSSFQYRGEMLNSNVSSDFDEVLSERELEVFTQLPCLVHLDLSAARLTQKGLFSLKGCKCLEKLRLSQDVPVSDLCALAALSPDVEIHTGGNQIHLARGTAYWSSPITDDDLKHLLPLEGLSQLTISNAQAITDKGLAQLAQLKLTKFLLSQSALITDDGIESLSKIKTLEHLGLLHCKQLTIKGIHCLQNLPNLRKLDTFGCGINQRTIAELLPGCVIE